MMKRKPKNYTIEDGYVRYGSYVNRDEKEAGVKPHDKYRILKEWEENAISTLAPKTNVVYTFKYYEVEHKGYFGNNMILVELINKSFA